MQGEPVVAIRGLRKVYEGRHRVVAVDGIDLDVRPGELFGLLGPNGAGKTTTIGVSTTRILPTAGTVAIAGIDVVREPARARRQIGVVPQFNTLDRSLTAWENVYFHCRYFGFDRTAAAARTQGLLKQFRLEERAQAFPNQLSGGLAQRLQVARAIAHGPRVLFLDEPSAGLDPQSRLALWGIVRDLRAAGITVVLTTHYMEEADALCDRVAIIDHGRILVCDTPAALKAGIGAQSILDLRMRSAPPEARQALAGLRGVRAVEPLPDGFRVLSNERDGLLPAVVAAAAPYGLRDVSVAEPTLETVFIRLTGRDLRE